MHPASLRWSLRLDESQAIVGRSPSVEVESGLTHGTVSRRHFEVRWDAQRAHHVGRDLGSHNGSRVDGRDIGTSTVALANNSVLQLGDVCVVYERFAPDIEPADEVTDLEEAIPGRAPAMVALRAMIARAAPDPSPVLLLGETGTGKEHIARELHRRSGRPGPLVSVNCSALNPQIIDSQLFGHVKGAFTGATTDQPGLFRAAGGGTLFLDEIGDLPLSLQPKLLRALQEGEVQPIGSAKLVPVDVRVIAATHADLVRRVDADAFRRDLYARLAMWELSVPPLRDRRGDVLDWLERMHTRWIDKRPEQPGDPLTLSPEAAETLLLHDWPSNLRDLDRLVHELASHPSLARPIAQQVLPEWLEGELPTAANPRQTVPSAPVAAKPPVPTREQFVAAFEQLEGNVRALAKHFDRDRRQIYRWIEAHDLSERRNKS
ncbi:MAG: sigma 54-interacting transcriptional regulator [Nannocystaceae bacterium]